MVAELTFSSDPRLAKVLRTVVHYFAQHLGFNECDTMNLMLVGDEVCSNIIRHGYDGRRDQSIYVRVAALPDRLEITFEDTGAAVPPERLRPRVLKHDRKNLKPGGLGTYFITTIMDHVHYESEPGQRNRLHLVKHLVKEPKP